MISFSVPSRGRPKLAARLVNSARSTANNDVEILFYLNSDDPTLQEYQDLLSVSYTHLTLPTKARCRSGWSPFD